MTLNTSVHFKTERWTMNWQLPNWSIFHLSHFPTLNFRWILRWGLPFFWVLFGFACMGFSSQLIRWWMNFLSSVWKMVCDKAVCEKDGVGQRRVTKMVCDKDVCDKVMWQRCVLKMACDYDVCDKDVCDKSVYVTNLCVCGKWYVLKMVCDKDVCVWERWCVCV